LWIAFWSRETETMSTARWLEHPSGFSDLA
jgi:hypothetical protein